MSVILVSLTNKAQLQKIDNLLYKISNLSASGGIANNSSASPNSICINIPQKNIDLYDACLAYLVHKNLPGEIVSENDLIKYVSESALDIFKKQEFLLYDPVNDSDQIVLNKIFEQKEDLFLLAEKYKNENNNSKAIDLYNQIIYNGDYTDQIKYLACLNLGKMSSDILDRTKYLLWGISFDHERAECYYELVILENSRGNSRKAAFYGLQCPLNSLENPRTYDSSKPQIHKVIHTYLLDINLGVACFYADLKQEGYLATLRALKGSVDENQRNMALSNLKFYTDVKKQLPYTPELLVVDNFYPDCYKMVTQLFDVNKQTREYTNIDLVVNDHSHFIIKPKRESTIARSMFRKIFNTDIGELCESSGLIYLKGGYMSNWVNYNHNHNHTWNVVVFLQPVSQGSTLELLRHNSSNYKEAIKEVIPTIERDVYDSSAWSVTEKVEEQFNRCIIYKGNRFFQFTKYYNGATLDSYMMYQSFCFDL